MDKDYSEQMLKVLQSLKDYIAIQDGLEIRLISEISLAAGGEGYVFTLEQDQPEKVSTEQAVKDMQERDQPEQADQKSTEQIDKEMQDQADQCAVSVESSDAKIRRHLGAIPPEIKDLRFLLFNYINHVMSAWVITDLAKAFGCPGDEVPARAAEFLHLTEENPENNGTASAEQEKNSAV